jgi:NADPH-dependent 2,4-dienoyl-CoA reductase/sulfur reductase-like enzyme
VLHTDTDAEALMADLKSRRPRTAAVVGAGYIGLEMVEALRAMGLQVALYSAGSHMLRRHDEVVTKAVVDRLERSRVEMHWNTRVQDASELGQDLIVWATGLQPNVELLADAGADLGRTGALRVSERMETSITGVYAAGDCCEATHLVTGRPAWVPLGTTANKMGRVAGANAAGRLERFPGIVGTSIVRVCGLAVGVTGLCAEGAKREGFQPVQTVIEARERPRYFRGRNVKVELVADRGSRRLLGAAVIGDEGVVGRINTLATALTARMKAEDLEHLDLAYAPPYATAMDPILIAAQQLLKKLDERGW